MACDCILKKSIIGLSTKFSDTLTLNYKPFTRVPTEIENSIGSGKKKKSGIHMPRKGNAKQINKVISGIWQKKVRGVGI